MNLKLTFAIALLSTTSLTMINVKPAHALVVGGGGSVACPSAVAGVITIDGATGTVDGCYITNGDADNRVSVNIATDGILNGYSNMGYQYGILSDGVGIYLGAINNAGTISTEEGILLRNGADIVGNITNSGTIEASSRDGILLFNASMTGDIINSGAINASSKKGIAIVNSSFLGNISNTGTIDGSEGGIYLEGISGSSNITNSGTVSDIVAYSSSIGSITNQSTGTINGVYESKVGRIVGISAYSTSLDSITNAGTINVAGAAATGIYVNNSNFNGVGIVNSGSIIADGGEGPATGIRVDNTVVSINNSGTIHADGYAIRLDTGGSSIVNTGVLDGNVLLSNSMTDTTLELKGNSSRIIGNVDGGEGAIVNITGDFTAEGYFNVAHVNIAEGGTLNAGSRTYTTISWPNTGFTNNGTLALTDTDSATINGSYLQAAGATLKIGASSASQYGKLAISGDATLAEGTNIFVNVAGTNTLADHDVLSSVISAATITSGTINVTDNSFLFSFTAVLNEPDKGSQTLDLSVAKTVAVSDIVSDNKSLGGVAPVIDQLMNDNPDSNFDPLINALGSLSTSEEISAAVQQLLPIGVGNSDSNVVLSALNDSNNVVLTRIQTLSGFSAGDSFIVHGNVWAQPFGSWNDFETYSGSAGFSGETYGMAFGADTEYKKDLTLGLGIAYSNSHVNSASEKLNVDNYQLIGYSDYKIDQYRDVDMRIIAGINKNAGERYINFGGLDYVASSDYSGYSLKASTGFNQQFLVDCYTTIVASERLDYNMTHNSGYSETGAGALDLNVEGKTVDELIPSLNVKVQHHFMPNVAVGVHAGVGYDVINQDSMIVSSFSGGGSSFTSYGNSPSPWVTHVGGNVNITKIGEADLSAEYDWERRGDKYDSNSASIKFSMPF